MKTSKIYYTFKPNGRDVCHTMVYSEIRPMSLELDMIEIPQSCVRRIFGKLNIYPDGALIPIKYRK